MMGCHKTPFGEGVACGLAMSAVVAIDRLPAADGDGLAAELLGMAGVSSLADIARMRNDPIDEYDVDFLMCHFGGMDDEELRRLALGQTFASSVSDRKETR